MPSVLLRVCPALRARRPAAWIAGPSAIGSVNGMPSSITSAPAPGSARRMASEVSESGSPAVRNVTSAARPSFFNAAKRRSIRVVIGAAACSCRSSIGQSLASSLPHRGHADADGAEHEYHVRADELHPLLLLQSRTRTEQSLPQEIEDEGRGYDDQDPADDLLPADHRRAPRWSATVKMSLSPRPHMFITIRWSFGFLGASSSTLASACAGSSAGMMPSSLEHSWKALSASLSVADRYFTRDRKSVV